MKLVLDKSSHTAKNKRLAPYGVAVGGFAYIV